MKCALLELQLYVTAINSSNFMFFVFKSATSLPLDLWLVMNGCVQLERGYFQEGALYDFTCLI